MTDSAQQRAPKPEAVQPEAVQPEAVQPEAQPADAEQAAAQQAEAQAGGDGAKPDLDEVKRRFREALDRKHQAHAEGQGKGGRDTGKIHGAHGPAASRRSFRRKSG